MAPAFLCGTVQTRGPGLHSVHLMNPLKIVAILLIVAGGLGLAYGGFSYTKATHQAEIGPLKLQVTEKQTVNIPLWAGIAAIAGGVLLLVISPRK